RSPKKGQAQVPDIRRPAVQKENSTHLGVFQHHGNELCFFIIRGGGGLNCFRTLIEVFKRVLAHQKGENNDNNTAHSSADGEPTHSAAILDVTASLSSCPTHDERS